MPDGQNVAEGTLNVDESSARDGSPAAVQEGFHDEMFQFSAPDPLQHNVDALAHVAENCASNILEQPTSFQEHEYPDEGVDVGHVPEELQEQVPALAEQFTEGASDQHIVPAVPVDLCADVDQNVCAIPEDQHAQHSSLFETNFGHAKEAAEPQTDFFGQQLSPKTFSVLPEGDQVQYVSPEHFSYVTGEKEELSSSPNLHQQMSVLSDDLVSIDLNASATQSLSDAVAVDIAGQIEQGAEAPCQVEPQEAHRNILTESIPEAQEAYPHAAGEVSENLGIEDAEDLSPAGSAESVVEKVAAEAQQESAVVFCQLKETPVSDEQNLFGESQLNETSVSEQNLFGENQLSENIEEPVDNQTAAFTSQPPLHFATEPWEGKESAVDDSHDNLGDFGASNFYADRPSTLSTVPEDLHNFLMSQQLAQSILERSEETKSPKSEAAQLPEPTADSQKSTHAADARATVQESVDFDSSSVQTSEHVLSGKGTSPEASVPSGLEFTVAVEESSETKPEITQVSLEEAQCSKEDQSSLTESSNVKPVSEEPSAPVDLGKIPENIPEADGVTEDSDSEKDGGWHGHHTTSNQEAVVGCQALSCIKECEPQCSCVYGCIKECEFQYSHVHSRQEREYRTQQVATIVGQGSNCRNNHTCCASKATCAIHKACSSEGSPRTQSKARTNFDAEGKAHSSSCDKKCNCSGREENSSASATFTDQDRSQALRCPCICCNQSHL
ncbi:hypothetical protein HPB47_026221, partial [Ixodes persulcatus]